MGSILVVVAVSVLAFVWVRGTRRNRLVWLKKLDLPGVWHADGVQLELAGDLAQGTFRHTSTATARTGSWILIGHQLTLRSDGAETRYDLRLFEAGKIGLRAANKESQVFSKEPSNVVPIGLRGR